MIPAGLAVFAFIVILGVAFYGHVFTRITTGVWAAGDAIAEIAAIAIAGARVPGNGVGAIGICMAVIGVQCAFIHITASCAIRGAVTGVARMTGAIKTANGIGAGGIGVAVM